MSFFNVLPHEEILLPVLIFLARAMDMSLSTLRIVFISQGRALLAALTGFFESLLWILVVAQALKHLSDPFCVLAYAGGFATGNIAGLWIEGRLAMGIRVLRIIVPGEVESLVSALRAADFGVTVAEGEGSRGPVRILFTLVRRRDVERALDILRTESPGAFFTLEDVRKAESGVFPVPSSTSAFAWPGWTELRKSR